MAEENVDAGQAQGDTNAWTEGDVNTGGNAQTGEGQGQTDSKDSNTEDKGGDEGTSEGQEGSDVEVDFSKFTVPEGMELNADALEAFKPLAKELGLKQEGAQKFVNIGVDLVQKVLDSQAQFKNDQSEAWAKEAAKDSEYGGEKFEKSRSFIAQGRDKFWSKEAIKALDDAGLGNHPEILRGFYKIGVASAEDSMAGGKGTPGSKPSIGDVMYDNSDHKG